MYTELIPNSWAAQYIDAYWIQSNSCENDLNITVLPDGCTDIIFSFDNNKCKQLVVGCMTKPDVAYIKPSDLLFGIRFKPGCAKAFLNISIKEIADKTISLTDVSDLTINALTPDLISCKKHLIHDIVEEKLKKLFSEKKFDKIIYSAADHIKQTHGTISIDDVSDTIGISRRHFERKFLDFVGMPPKLFSRIMRFLYANKILNAQNTVSCASISMDSGYYDQAHFCKDHKEFSGLAPLTQKRGINK